MIQVKLVGPNDYQRWDTYLANKPEASPYHSIAWKSAIEDAYKHKCFYLIAESKGDIAGVLPLALINPPFLSGSLHSLPFCDLGGCIHDTCEVKEKLLEKALEIADTNNAKHLELRQSDTGAQLQNCSKEELSKALANKKVSMMLSLPDTSEELMSNFKSKLRSQIRKAEKNGLISELGRDPEHIRDFYQVFTQNMRHLGSPVHSFDWFDAIRQHFGDNMIIALVKREGIVIGAGIVLIINDKASIPWASTLVDANRYAPNMLLYWSLLKYVNDRGCRQFDFGRSTYGEGTYKFKAQWGAKPVPLDWTDYLHLDTQNPVKSESSIGNIRLLVENVWRKLPLSLTNAFGPKIRKYISL